MLALPPVSWVRVEGENFSVSDLATLQRWVLEKRVLREDSCSHDGAHWTPLGGRPELQLFFAASDRLEKSSASAQHALLTMAHSAADDVFADAPSAAGEEVGWLTDARTELLPTPQSSPAQIAIGDTGPLEVGEADEDDEQGDSPVHQLSFGMNEVEQLPDLEDSGGRASGRSPSGTAGVRVGIPGKGDESTGARVAVSRPVTPMRPVPPPMVPLADEIASRPAPGGRVPELVATERSAAERAAERAAVDRAAAERAAERAAAERASAERAAAERSAATPSRPAERPVEAAGDAASKAEAARPRPVAVRAGTPVVTGAVSAERTVTATRNPTDPKLPRAPAEAPPRLHTATQNDDEGPSLGTWVGVGIVAVSAALIALWLGGGLGPNVPKRGTADASDAAPVKDEEPARPLRPGDPVPAEDAVDGDPPAGSTTSDQVVLPGGGARADQPEAPPVRPGADVASTPPTAAPVPTLSGSAATTASTPSTASATRPSPVKSSPVTTPPVTGSTVTGSAARPATTVVGSAPSVGTSLADAPTKPNPRAAAKPGWDAVETEDYKAAYTSFGTALADDPGNVWALYGRAYASEKMGETEAARRDYCAAIARTKSTDLLRDLRAGVQRIGKSCE